jgi:nucleoside-diphosphate-sugar epimerase
MSTILVTGANGFIGSHLAARLAADGHRVRGLVRKTSDLAFLDGLSLDLRTGDVTDRDSLRPALEGVEVVVHAAGAVSDWGPWEVFRSVNVDGTRNVAEAARDAGVRRLVHIGTAAVHGFEGFRNRDETAPLVRSPFPYCETKREAEEWLLAFARTAPLEAAVIRPGNVFGPRDHTFAEKYLDALAAGKAGYVGGGHRWTCPAYVENLVDGIVLACFEPAARGEAFLITDGLEIDWRTFTEALAAELGVEAPRLSLPFPLAYAAAWVLEAVWRALRRRHPPLLTRYRICNGGRDYHFSIAKAGRLLRYAPRVGFAESVRRTVAWYRQKTGWTPPAAASPSSQ